VKPQLLKSLPARRSPARPVRLRLALALAPALALAACSFADDTLMPSLAGEDPRGAAAPSAAATAGGATSASTASQADAASGAAGGRLGQLRADLKRLQGDVAQHQRALAELRAQLEATTAAVDAKASGIETRLASRNVPNDPQLLGDWNEAEGQLNRSSDTLARLTNVSTWATSDAALASYVLQTVRAAQSQPDASPTERRQLGDIESEANRSSQQIDQLVTQIGGEISSRNLFVATAHRRLATLATAINSGRPARALAGQPAPPPAETRRALVTIRFDRPDVAYQQELYGALTEALQRRPDLALDVVAVSPPGQPGASAAAAKRNVENVVDTLAQMGLPPDRIRLSARTLADATGNEIRIYPR
jgi:hypothetical protein